MAGGEKSDSNPAVDAAIAEYLELLERGARPDEVAFLARHPEIAGELRQFIDDYHSVQRGAAPRDDTGVKTYSLHLDPRPKDGVPIDEIRYFGDYELLEEIERGGMGVVFKARQKTLNRIVAVKLILAGQLASKREVDRFYAEAQAAAKLDHRNIVPIFEVGEHRGQHYYSMAYVPGASLALRILGGPIPPREAATMIREAALAVHYAHGQGVIHRDLKPANILIDADGEPRVTDFGLAKQISDESGLTATGQVLGT